MNNNTGEPTVKLGDIDLSTNSYTFSMPISREHAIIEGLAKPTPAEVATHNARSRASWEQSVAQWKKLDAATAELNGLADPLARKILDLHACADGAAECIECSDGDEDGYPTDWPCATVLAVANHFGVTLPDGYLGSRPSDAPHEMPAEGYQPIRWEPHFRSAFVDHDGGRA